jgi:chitinase
MVNFHHSPYTIISQASAETMSTSKGILLLIPWLLVIATINIIGGEAVSYSHEGSRGDGDNDWIIAGYLPDYRFYIDVNQTVTGLTDLILFSLEPPHFNCCMEKTPHWTMAKQAVAHHQREQSLRKDTIRQTTKTEAIVSPLKLWVTVGGAGRSAGFADLLQDATGQEALFKRIIALAAKHKLTGIDFDCELPFTQQQYYYYMLFLEAACDRLHQEGLLVSVAIHPQQPLSSGVIEKIDRVHLMAYDFAGPPHHADLERVKKTIDFLLEGRGGGGPVPPHKVVLGLPAYGRHLSNPGMVQTYAELADGLKENGLMIRDDTHIAANGVRFDSPNDIRKKLMYARHQYLAGVFVWEVGQDKTLPTQGASRGVVVDSIHGKLFSSNQASASGETAHAEEL